MCHQPDVAYLCRTDMTINSMNTTFVCRARLILEKEDNRIIATLWVVLNVSSWPYVAYWQFHKTWPDFQMGRLKGEQGTNRQGGCQASVQSSRPSVNIWKRDTTIFFLSRPGHLWLHLWRQKNDILEEGRDISGCACSDKTKCFWRDPGTSPALFCGN